MASHSRIILLVITFFAATFLMGLKSEIPFFEGTMNYQVKFSGPVADDLKLNEPNNTLELHIKDGSYIVNLKGGRYPKTFLYLNDKDVEVSINMQEKKAYKYSPHSDLNRENKEIPVAEFTGKTAEVHGTICDLYRMKKENAHFLFYVSDDYRVDLNFYEGKKRAKPFFLVKGLEGRIPLKIVKKTSDLTVITLIKKINPREFDPVQFELPEGFEIGNRDYRP